MRAAENVNDFTASTTIFEAKSKLRKVHMTEKGPYLLLTTKVTVAWVRLSVPKPGERRRAQHRRTMAT